MNLFGQIRANRKIQVAFLMVTWACMLVGYLNRHTVMNHLRSMRSQLTGDNRLATVRLDVQPRLEQELAADARRFRSGAPVFIRIFKESKELEVWLQLEGDENGKPAKFAHFKTYPIANYGRGTLAPKLAEGDGQAPTGFYTVAKSQLKPDSDYHLAFNLGFPNRYDRQKGRTGSFLMVHGSTVSIGCYAMTDPLIEEIYLLVDTALHSGQKAVSVHAFPFRMTDERLKKAATIDEEKPWLKEWQNLKEGYDLFEQTQIPPEVTTVPDGRYRFK